MSIAKILIANRSEIAVRVINTCRLMGIPTVAVYAEDDRSSLHREMADEAYSLGTGALAETYLNQEKMVQLALQAGAQAIHPGYGFLSERGSFCELCHRAGLVFIGPRPETIALMGDKRESKKTLGSTDIPLIPGYHGQSQDSAELFRQAQKIGTPLLIKATAGGGGKGMRLVEDLGDFERELAGAKREAQNAFGNGDVLLEKFIPSPRHIEVQVLSDAHGQHLHFWERECSIQRRHQKVIEETPSPALSASLRREICETAVRLCRAIDYLGAGTVEFIFDGADQRFYFLEMNTRLQVEHPITELVTGYDLVEGQIRVARGEKLPWSQGEIGQRGHAIEARLYAEDPERDFLPTTGTVGVLGSSTLSSVRLECGYREGAQIGIQYDPMVAKLCCHSHDRPSAIAKMSCLLDDYPFLGLQTNRDFLQRVLAHPSFGRGQVTTHFIAEHRQALGAPTLTESQLAEAAAAYLLLQSTPAGTALAAAVATAPSLFQELGGFSIFHGPNSGQGR